MMNPIRRRTRRRVLQVLGAASALSIAFVALVGVAHTEFGRPLLRYIPGMGACPLDVATLTAEDRMRVRGEQLAALGGEGEARSRNALAFELGTTTRADIDAWASSHDVQCAPGRSTALRCDDVPAAALGKHGFDEVSFEFDTAGVLLTVESSGHAADAASAAEYVARRDASLRAVLGEPTIVHGDAVAASVSRGPLSQISREFRCSDVRARVIATNLGRGRYGVREFHQLVTG